MQNGVLRSPNRERPKVPFPRLPGVTFYRKMCRFFPIDRLPSSSEGKNFFRARNPKRKGKGLQNLIWWFNSIPRLHLPSIQSTKKARAPQPSRPEESWAFGPPKVMKNGSCSATTIPGSAALPFVISTGGVMGLRPTQGDEKRVLFPNDCCWKRRPPLCHLDRRSHGPSAHPRR
jgi:hypothetical protein